MGGLYDGKKPAHRVIEVTKCTYEHIDNLAPRVAEADLLEVSLSCGLPIRQALIESMESSEYCWAFEDDEGSCLGVFGYACPFGDDEIGVPWLIASDDLRARAVEFYKLSVAWVDVMSVSCPKLLINYVHADNKRAIRWLTRLGFTVEETPEPFGVAQAPFRKFYK